jgi:hypothetical protein
MLCCLNELGVVFVQSSIEFVVVGLVQKGRGLSYPAARPPLSSSPRTALY